MSYTKEERQQIAAQIMDYRRHLITEEARTPPPATNEQVPTSYLEGRPTTYQLQWLEIVALDVLGEIDHDSHPLELRRRPWQQYPRHA